MEDNSLVMPIRQALSTQEEPIFEEITTEGFTNDGYLDKRLIEARKVLNRELDRPRWHIWLHTQDSEKEVWQDEKTWVKSNPDLGVIKKWSFLRQMVEEARTNTETRAFVLAKDFNIKQNSTAAWLMENEYLNVDGKFNPSEFKGCIGLGAVDLAETTDLACAKMLIMRAGDNRKFFLTKYFIPQSKLDDKNKDPEAHYQDWVNQGLIEVSPGNENDFSLITKWFVNLYKQYNIKPYKVGYDNALAKYWVKEMESCGFDMERVNQDKYSMSSPMRLVGDDLRAHLIVYNDNPVDRYCFKNTAMQLDSTGRYIMPVKIKGNTDRRIDGCVTTIIDYAMYTRYRAEYLSMVR
jgi:phage terminase large subunit-like protein